MLTAVAASTLLGAAVVHASVVDEHFREWWLEGVFFLALQVVETALAFALVVRPSQRVTGWLCSSRTSSTESQASTASRHSMLIACRRMYRSRSPCVRGLREWPTMRRRRRSICIAARRVCGHRR